jgi:NADH:ubiquinone oxidoreductase subunit
VDQSPPPAYMSRMHLGTRIATFFRGNLVGTDAAGNHYYQERGIRPNGRARRWIIYNGPVEASAVPPEWHSWLHYTTDKPIQTSAHRPWGKAHIANATGTPDSYRPPGHDYEGGQRDRATGDYESWTPGSQ